MQRLFDEPFREWLAEHARPVILVFAAVSALLVLAAPQPGEAREPEATRPAQATTTG